MPCSTEPHTLCGHAPAFVGYIPQPVSATTTTALRINVHFRCVRFDSKPIFPLLRLRNFINSARVPRTTLQKALRGEPTASHDPKPIDSLYRIFGTSWRKSATRSRERRNKRLVYANQQDCDHAHDTVISRLIISRFLPCVGASTHLVPIRDNQPPRLPFGRRQPDRPTVRPIQAKTTEILHA